MCGRRALDVANRVLGGGPRVQRVIEGRAAFPGGDIQLAVDVVRGLKIADVVVQEGAQPRAAGFRVGGEPEEAGHSITV